MASDNFSGVKGIVEVSSDISQRCELCDFHIEHDKFSEAVNHYISQHGLRVLFVGNRTVRDNDDNPCDTSIAILGSDAEIPKRELKVKFELFKNDL